MPLRAPQLLRWNLQARPAFREYFPDLFQKYLPYHLLRKADELKEDLRSVNPYGTDLAELSNEENQKTRFLSEIPHHPMPLAYYNKSLPLSSQNSSSKNTPSSLKISSSSSPSLLILISSPSFP